MRTEDGQPAAHAEAPPTDAAGGAQEILKISIVVPVLNEEDFIARTLDGLLAQDFPASHLEIFVVDAQSTDRTAEIVAEYASRHDNIRLLSNPRRWSSSARIGARAATGEIFLLVDGHTKVQDRQYLAKIAEAFRRSGADCVGRPQPLNVSGATVLQRAIAAARASRLGHHPHSFIYSGGEHFVPAHSVAVAYRSRVFDKIGYFDELFDACEDVEFNHRVDQAGLRCFFTDRVSLPYVPRNTLRKLFQQLARYGRGRMRLLRKHPDTFSWRTLIPAVFVAGLVLGFISMWFSTVLAIVYASALAFYIVAVLGTSLSAAIHKRDVRILPWLPLVFVAIHLGAGCGILTELLIGPQRPAA